MSEEQVLFNLKKDEPFSLEKLEPGITNIYVGLSWDPSIAGADVDLDAVLIATDDNGKAVKGQHSDSFLFYDNHGRDGTAPKAFTITEDDIDGKEDIDSELDDNEAIFIDTTLVSPEMKELRIFVTFYNAGSRSLQDVKNVKLTIAPLVNGVPDMSFEKVAVFNVSEVGSGKGMHMASLIPNPVKGWDILPVSQQVGDLSQIMVVHGLAEK